MKKLFHFAFFLFTVVSNYNFLFELQATDIKEEFKILRLSHDPEKIESSQQRVFPTIDSIDEEYSDEMAKWHQESLEKLKVLDQQVNKGKEADRDNHRNLCFLKISVIYVNEDKKIKRDKDFNDILFLSGREFSKSQIQDIKVGQIDLNNNPFTVKLEPGVKVQGLPKLPSEIEQTMLMYSGKADEPSIKLNKYFVSLDEFFSEPLSFEKHIIEYFRFSSVLSNEDKQVVKRAFGTNYQSELRKNSALNSDALTTIAQQSLDNALLYLPFSLESNDKSQKYFSQSADTLFRSFKRNFHDSEQAIRLFIEQNATKNLGQDLCVQDNETPYMNPNLIKKIYINIASVRHMCPICQGTYLYDIKEKKSITRAIFRAIFTAQSKNLKQIDTLLSDNLVVIYASGILPTTKDKK